MTQKAQHPEAQDPEAQHDPFDTLAAANANLLSRRMQYLEHRRRMKVGYENPFVPVSLKDVCTRAAFAEKLAECVERDPASKETLEEICRRMALRTDLAS